MRAEPARLRAGDAFATLSLLWPAAALRRALRQQAAASHLTPEQAASLWRETRLARRQPQPSRPGVAPGLALLLRYMAWDVALYRGAQTQGLPPAEAAALVRAVNARLFEPGARLAFALSRLRSGRLERRVAAIIEALFALVFTRPFARRRVVAADAVAFDVSRCPLAEYFRAAGVPELTAHAACATDFMLARAWGAPLQRMQTLADGGTHCDFRFVVVEERTGVRTAG